MSAAEVLGLGAAIAVFTAVITVVVSDMAYRSLASRPAVICAWCAPPRVLRPGRLPATHTICKDCLARERGKETSDDAR